MPTSHRGDGMCPVVMACDERFAMPLATALRSLCDNNQRHWPLQVHVLTDDFSPEVRQRVEQSLPRGAAALHWQHVDVHRFENYPLPTGLTPISLARLGIPEMFREQGGRVLYLDADLLVLGDLAELCNIDMCGAPLAAVIDFLAELDFKAGRLEHRLGMPKVTSYFNSGVLLFDVDASIRHGLTARAMEYLAANTTSPYPDQDALNVACDRAWKKLSPLWNFQGHRNSPVRVDRLPPSERPHIVHFVWIHKPWIPRAGNVNAPLYNYYRGRTRFPRSLGDSVVATGEQIKHYWRGSFWRVRGVLGRLKHFCSGLVRG